MRSLKIAVFLLIIFIFQTVVLSRIGFFGAKLDLIVPSVIIFGLLFGESEGLWAGLFCGIFMDVFSSSRTAFLIILPVMGVLSGMFREKVFKEQAFVMFVCVLAGSIAAYWSLAWFMDVFYAVKTDNFWKVCLLGSFAGACASPVLSRGIMKAGEYEQY